jgi:AAA+ ATPase superfamily predicted ATPase
VLDEFPYLTTGAPELPSVLQRWIDHEKREGGILLALSGSSQRMMMDSVLNAEAPLYGRADQIMKLEPLLPGYIGEVLNISSPQSLLDFYTCWGGVPRYWELAQPFHGRHREALDELVLSPLGVLHDEIDRLLRQEMPSAVPLRPILDAIGMGAHKSSEIAARLQTPATSLTRSLQQLQQLGYVRREVPYDENEKRSKKALYHMADPFLRLWFKVVAPHRGSLRMASKSARLRLLDDCWLHLRAQAWEELCRLAVPHLGLFDRQWHSAGRYWNGNQSEWDVASTSLDNEMTILGECKSLARTAEDADIDKIVRALMAKTIPTNLRGGQRREYVIFVPEVSRKSGPLPAGITLVDGNALFAALTDAAE